MCIFKKKKKDEWEPMFPVYIDTLKVKDNLAIRCDGITTMYSVAEDLSKHAENRAGMSVEAGVYKTTLKSDLTGKDVDSRKHSEKYERIHTDASLLYKLLGELKNTNKIKNISTKDDIEKAKEGDVVLLEGKISGTETMLWINKLLAFINAFSSFDQTGNLQSAAEQLNVIKDAVVNNKTMSNAMNMVCTLDDDSETLLFMDMGYLIGDTGVELKHGKFKVLGVVYEKKADDEEFDLTRDSMFSVLGEKIITSMLEALSNITDDQETIKLPEQKTKIKGPSIGILPIGIYL